MVSGGKSITKYAVGTKDFSLQTLELILEAVKILSQCKSNNVNQQKIQCKLYMK